MTTTANPNAHAMRGFAAALARAGVRDACISPGSRSTATALALVQTGIRPWVITDERAAGFFALGLARAARRPVVLLCTSGTAAANYLPAVVEASLSEIPLLVLTADRPPELRDCHAAQTIDQVRLYGSHARWSVDAATPSPGVDLGAYFATLASRAVAAATERPAGPVHVNLPMREPLLDVADERRVVDASVAAAGNALRIHAANDAPSAEAVADLAARLMASARGLLVCGPGAATSPDDAAAIARLAARLEWPIVADPLSGLRFGRHDRSRVIDAYDVVLQGRGPDALGAPDAVVQLGTPVVSARLQRLLASARPTLHVLVAPPGRWPDPSHGATDVVRADPAALATALVAALPAAPAGARRWLDGWREPAATVRTALDGRLDEEPTLFEGTVIADVVARLGDGTTLHVGNSLPVRALDAFAGTAAPALQVACNRGANGIDGVVATALGATAAGAPTVLVVGDLSFLHDVGALQIAARHSLPLLVVVVNNDGGGIFSFLPQAELGDAVFETLFTTPHGLSLEGSVAMCGGRYVLARSRGALGNTIDAWRVAPAFTVIEVPVDRAASRALHARLVEYACRTSIPSDRRSAEAR
jgi:2-succinyl-5-enolpyruvyl-6-hydroxy-3-cyclohexene-1-carboxylate synthase